MMMKVILLIGIFVLGFFGARELSANREVGKVPTKVVRKEVRHKKVQTAWSVAPNGEASANFARRLGSAEESLEDSVERRDFFMDWFRIDPDAAVEAIKTSPKAKGMGGARFFLSFLFEEEPDEVALQAMGERLDEMISVGQWHDYGFGGEAYRWFDFAVGKSLVERIEGLPESYLRQDLWNYAMAGWCCHDWEEAAAWSNGLTGKEKRKAEAAFFSEGILRQVAKDADARKWMAEVLAREGNRDLLVQHGPKLVEYMARQDPQNSLKWANDHLGGMALAKAVSGVVSTTYRQDPKQAIAMVDELPFSGARQQAARSLVELQMRTDGVGAFERARAEEAAGLTMGVQTWLSLGRSFGQQDPAKVREVIEGQSGLDRTFQSQAVETAFWKEPEAARRWAEKVEGPRRDAVIDLVFRAWFLREQKEAQAWRDSLPE